MIFKCITIRNFETFYFLIVQKLLLKKMALTKPKKEKPKIKKGDKNNKWKYKNNKKPVGKSISVQKSKEFNSKDNSSENEGFKKIDKTKLMKYDRGKPINTKMVSVKFEQKRIDRREKKIQYGLQQSVRSEVLLTEDSGYLEPDEDEITTQFTQTNIKNSVDPLSASKRFDLHLKDFGPYRMSYTRNGRFLLLAGRKGHVAAMDWITKKLMCEINVMESTYDITWLHQETLFAVAQKKWVYIYDNQGIEIHCVKKLYNVVRTMFLPYHFLLATVSSNGFISWLDVSIGKMVEQFHLRSKKISSSSVVAQHPANAMICVGEPNGVVSFWGPNSKKPSVIKICHKSPLCAVAFDPKGLNFVTAGMDKCVKIWDARNLNGPLQHYLLRSPPNCISMSHKGVMALGLGNMVEVYNDTVNNGTVEKKIYLRHKVPTTISNMEFCPFEDVLGVAHSNGFTSMLVPGSGEPNFDALEVNPFQTKSQRKEAEVKALLGKIPSDLITWDTSELRKVDIPSLEEIIEAKKQISFVKPPDIKFVPKKKKGKKAGSVKADQRKKIMKEDFRRNYYKEMKNLKEDAMLNQTEETESPAKSVLDRFKVKRS